ncbi:RNA-binding protein [Sulfolobus tengchongensis]|uniref:RNA-binding protein n=1 Tax=Sulfolobus tengchongensis TaxID=207809 RepID=A0AAX4KYA8_9CREN
MQRHVMSSKDAKVFINKIKEKYNIDVSNAKLEVGKEKKEVWYYVDGLLAFFDDFIPTLCGVMKLKIAIPYVIIDEGAVKAVSRGADLFVPGIVEYDCECKEGDIILAKTKTNLPVAILRVVMPKEKALSEKKGKFAETLHHVGDKLWEMCNG